MTNSDFRRSAGSETDIAVRLRNFCVWNNRQSHYEPVPLCQEAATEIERLRGDLRAYEITFKRIAEEDAKSTTLAQTSQLTDAMVEAGAQALCEKEWHPPQPLSSMSKRRADDYRQQARLVLSAALAAQPPAAPVETRCDNCRIVLKSGEIAPLCERCRENYPALARSSADIEALADGIVSEMYSSLPTQWDRDCLRAKTLAALRTVSQQQKSAERHYFATEDEVVSLGLTVQGQAAELEKALRRIEGLETLRPVWAQGYTSDSAAAQASSTALAGMWKLLGVNNQTDAMQKLRTLNEPQPLSVWHPIETAPKDGTPIEACNTRHPSHAPVIVRWDDDGLSDDVPEPHWCDAATRDGEALYYNQNYFDFWKPTTALPRPHGGRDHE